MKHKLLILSLLLLSLSATKAFADPPAALAQLFDGRYHNNLAATETKIAGDPLKPYSLDMFHSLSVTNDATLAIPLEKAVSEGSKGSLWEETVRKGGRLESGVFELPRQGSKRRYILYLNRFLSGGKEAAVIYLEGKATPKQIKKLIKTLSE